MVDTPHVASLGDDVADALGASNPSGSAEGSVDVAAAAATAANVVGSAPAAVAVAPARDALLATATASRRCSKILGLLRFLLRPARRASPIVATQAMDVVDVPDAMLEELLDFDDDAIDAYMDAATDPLPVVSLEALPAVGLEMLPLAPSAAELHVMRVQEEGERACARADNAIAQVRPPASTMVRPAVPKHFTGKSGGTHVHVWLRSTMQYLRLCRVAPEDWVAFAETYLDAEAANVWYSAQLRDPAVRVWKGFSTVLLTQFGDVHSVQTARDGLDALVCGEPVDRAAVQELCHDAGNFMAEITHVGPDGTVHHMDTGSQQHIVMCKIKAAGVDGQMLYNSVRNDGPFSTTEQLFAQLIHRASVARLSSKSRGRDDGFTMGHGKGRRNEGASGSGRGSERGGGSGRGSERGGVSDAYGKGHKGNGSGATRGGTFKDIKRVPFELQASRTKAEVCKWCGKAGHKWIECAEQNPVLGH